MPIKTNSLKGDWQDMVVAAGQEEGENLSANRHVSTYRRKHLFEKNRQIIQA